MEGEKRFCRSLDQVLRPTGCLPTFLGDMIAAGLAPDPLAFVRDDPADPAAAPGGRP